MRAQIGRRSFAAQQILLSSVYLAALSLTSIAIASKSAKTETRRRPASQDASGVLSKVKDQWLKLIQQSDLKQSEISFYASADDSSRAAWRERELLVPASLSKIPTAAAVLSLFPPGFKTKTRFLADPSQIKGTVLKGPLYLVGGGDPAFVSESMWFLVNEFVRKGINEIEGDLIVDDTLFDADRFPDGRDSQRVDRAYDAPLGAMSFNWNSVSIYVQPSSSAAATARVLLDPALALFEVSGQVKTSSGGASGPQVERLALNDSKEKFFVSGAISNATSEKVIYKSIRQPDLYSGYAAVEFLKQRGIIVKGTVRTGQANSAQLEAMGTVESKPLPLIVTDMMKWSNNFAAEMLVKLLASESGEKPATMKTGLEQVRSWLASRVGLAAKDFRYVNASGLTRDNQFTTSQMVTILDSIRKDFRIYPEFAASLPIAGADGTLRSRFGSKGTHWVRAKTGLLTGVVGLAGYAGNADGRVVTFAFIFNGRPGKAESARALFDRMASQLSEID